MRSMHIPYIFFQPTLFPTSFRPVTRRLRPLTQCKRGGETIRKLTSFRVFGSDREHGVLSGPVLPYKEVAGHKRKGGCGGSDTTRQEARRSEERWGG
jgi:hypothetical protein